MKRRDVVQRFLCEPLDFRMLLVETVNELLLPDDLTLQSLDALFDNLWPFDRSAKFPRLRHWINREVNGFAALTDGEFVLSVVAAVLDFTKAQGLRVGLGWVHMAMIWFVAKTL